MKKLHVGMFVDTFYPMVDGVVTVVDNLAKELSKKCKVTVFTIKPADKNKVDNVKHSYEVVRAKSKSIFFLDYDLPTPGSDKEFKKALKDSDLDIVYFHSPMILAKHAIKYAKEKNIPIISHMHSQYKRDFYRATHSKLLTKFLLNKIIKTYNQSDLAIAVNEFTQDLFVKEYGLKAKSTVVYNTTDMTPVDNIEKVKDEINKQYSLTPDQKVFLYVGRINKLKNIDLTVDALNILKNRYSNFKFLVVGSGKELKYFESKTKKLNLENNICFLGRVAEKEQLKKLYARADLFLFPSFYDTDGVVKMEAAAQKTPTVFVEGSGAASSIIDNETGFIAKNSPEAFADKIYEAITNKDLYSKVSENVLKKLYRTIESSAEEIYNIILKAIKDKK